MVCWKSSPWCLQCLPVDSSITGDFFRYTTAFMWPRPIWTMDMICKFVFGLSWCIFLNCNPILAKSHLKPKMLKNKIILQKCQPWDISNETIPILSLVHVQCQIIQMNFKSKPKICKIRFSHICHSACLILFTLIKKLRFKSPGSPGGKNVPDLRYPPRLAWR